MVHKPTTAPHTRNGDEYHLQNGKHPSPAYENPPSPEESSIPTTTLTTIFNGADGIKRHQANGILQHCITYKPQPNQPTTVFNMMESTQTVLTSSNFIASNPNGKPAEPRKRRVAQPRKRATKQPSITSIDTTPYASVLPMVQSPTVALPPSISSLPSIQHTLSIQPTQFPPLASSVPAIEQPRIDLKADVETDISDDEAPPSIRPPEQRILERKWEKTRCSVAWRWTWLQLQVHELEFQMNKCDELLQKKKRSKQKVLPLFDSEDKHHAVRTSGLSKPTKNRKLFRVPSSKSKSSSSLDRAAESHPLFSIHQVPKRPPKRKREDPIKLEKTIQKQVKKTPPAEPPSLRSSSNKSKSRKKARATSRPQLPPQQQLPTQQTTQQQQPINPKKKKKYLRTSDFDIDNYVMPYGMAVATPVIPEFDDSEIQTPTWRIIEDLLGSSSEAESDGEEDTSDEKFALRHFPNELLERKRYLEPLTQKKRRGGNMPRIPSRGNLSSDFPDEFLVSPLETNDRDELNKLEEKKLKLIRETYLNHTQFKPKRWEEIAPSDYFDHRRFFWEVIQSRAIDEGKNVIYVRRTPKSLEEMQKEEGFEDESDAAEWFEDENGTDEDETDVEFLMGEEVGVEEEETDDGEYAKKKRVRKR